MRSLALAASVLQAGLALFLYGVASGSSTFPNPPEVVPRGLALGLLYAIPGAIGALGAVGLRRSLVGAAGVLDSIGSVLAFSGVTLIFLVPALIFAAAAGAVETPIVPSRPRWSLPLLVALALPVAFVAVMLVGLFAVPGFILLVACIEAWRGSSRSRPRTRLAGGLAALAIIGLMIGSGWALLSMTETRCWKAYQTPAGVVYQTVPESRTMSLEATAIAGGCDGGELTIPGSALAGLLATGALAIALMTARSRPTDWLVVPAAAVP